MTRSQISTLVCLVTLTHADLNEMSVVVWTLCKHLCRLQLLCCNLIALYSHCACYARITPALNLLVLEYIQEQLQVVAEYAEVYLML